VKKGLSFAAALLAATPAMARNGHVFQVHHGYDGISFVLWEDVAAICGANDYNLTGTINDQCLESVPWYGVSAGEGLGGTPLTAAQLAPFILMTQAIDTVYKLYMEAVMLQAVQTGSGLTITQAETLTLLEDSNIGFDVTGQTFEGRSIGGAPPFAVNAISSVNTPASDTQ
jgi:hypothetical protein